MLPLQHAIHRFWFRPISGGGFGLMRIGYGIAGFVTFALELPNLQRFYGPDGVLPQDMVEGVLRSTWRFSLLDHASPGMVSLLGGALLLSFLFTAIGIYTRAAVLTSVVLLFSFHEYGTITLDGGDTLMRLIGFILMLSPCGRTLSIDNLLERLRRSTETGLDQPASERTMPIWPYRLLFWQMIVLYGASVIEKAGGSAWQHGSAVAIVLHNGTFSRLPFEWSDQLTFFSPLLTYFTLAAQASWVFLLPLGLLRIFGVGIHDEGFNSVKRGVIFANLLIHGMIALLMDVGTFSFTVFSAYAGLLIDDDFRAIRGWMNRSRRGVTTVLFDGRCGLCTGSTILIRSLDVLHRVEFHSYHEPSVRKMFAPDIPLAELEKEMHVRLPDGSHRQGFFAFRALAKDLPFLWPLVPLLTLPPIPMIGKAMYTWFASRRHARG